MHECMCVCVNVRSYAGMHICTYLKYLWPIRWISQTRDTVSGQRCRFAAEWPSTGAKFLPGLAFAGSVLRLSKVAGLRRGDHIGIRIGSLASCRAFKIPTLLFVRSAKFGGAVTGQTGMVSSPPGQTTATIRTEIGMLIKEHKTFISCNVTTNNKIAEEIESKKRDFFKRR